MHTTRTRSAAAIAGGFSRGDGSADGRFGTKRPLLRLHSGQPPHTAEQMPKGRTIAPRDGVDARFLISKPPLAADARSAD